MFSSRYQLARHCCDLSGLSITPAGIEFVKNLIVGNDDLYLLQENHWIRVVAGLHVSLTCSPLKHCYSTLSVSNIISFTLHDQKHIEKNHFKGDTFQFMVRMSFQKQVVEINEEYWARCKSEARYSLHS